MPGFRARTPLSRMEGLTRPVNFESSSRCARKCLTQMSEYR
jgi:hypothetical protein